MTPPDEIAAGHWWDEPAAAFDVWLAAQPDDVQDMALLAQIDLYAELDARLTRATPEEPKP